MSNPYPIALAPGAANHARKWADQDEAEIAYLEANSTRLQEELASIEILLIEARRRAERSRSLSAPPIPPAAPFEEGQDVLHPGPCRNCAALVKVPSETGLWTHEGREQLPDGHVCYPGHADSTVASPEPDDSTSLLPSVGDDEPVLAGSGAKS